MIVAAVSGGGLVALLTVRETKEGKRLDNAERLVEKYEELMQKLETSVSEKDAQIEKLTEEVNSLRADVAELKTRLKTAEMINSEDRYLRCEKTQCKMRKPKLCDKNTLKNA